VATGRWTSDQRLRKVLPEVGEPLWRDPTGKLVLAELAFAPHWIGEQVNSGAVLPGLYPMNAEAKAR